MRCIAEKHKLENHAAATGQDIVHCMCLSHLHVEIPGWLKTSTLQLWHGAVLLIWLYIVVTAHACGSTCKHWS